MKNLRIFLLAVMVSLQGPFLKSQNYAVDRISDSRILIDSSFDGNLDTSLVSFIGKYRSKMETTMKVRLGVSAQTMKAGYPESLLTNLTSDVMKKYAEQKSGEKIDFALMNVHGHRASLPSGPITFETLFEIYPFQNTLVLLKLKGKYVRELFDFYARHGGEGVSSDVHLVISGKKVKSLAIGGLPLINGKTYTIATIDYLAGGNDGMEALLKASSVQDTGIELRNIMIDYVKFLTARGREVRSVLDKRIVVEN